MTWQPGRLPNRLQNNYVRPLKSMSQTAETTSAYPRRMLKTVVQQGRSDAKKRGVPLGYVEPRSEARTTLAGVFSIPLDPKGKEWS